MVFDFHYDKERYFNYQYLHSKEYIVPLVNQYLDFSQKLRILEIGSAEAGVLKAFTELGHDCVGVEISETRVNLAKHFMKTEFEAGQVKFYDNDVFNVSVDELGGKFDLIILKDVIEHIHHREVLYNKFKEFLKPQGFVFIAMPPWNMPFGGHQQMLKSKFHSRFPYFHLLPMWFTKLLLKWGHDPYISEWEDLKRTQISINGFQREAKLNGFKISKAIYYFINPNYKFKFNLQPREQSRFIASIPWLRDFFTTTVYYLIETEK
ncbi:MAG: methyltransferase domain-containing protein [Bacteroidota bacterium]